MHCACACVYMKGKRNCRGQQKTISQCNGYTHIRSRARCDHGRQPKCIQPLNTFHVLADALFWLYPVLKNVCIGKWARKHRPNEQRIPHYHFHKPMFHLSIRICQKMYIFIIVINNNNIVISPKYKLQMLKAVALVWSHTNITCEHI